MCCRAEILGGGYCAACKGTLVLPPGFFEYKRPEKTLLDEFAMAVLAAGARRAHDGLLMLAVDTAHVRAGDVVGGEGDMTTVA